MRKMGVGDCGCSILGRMLGLVMLAATLAASVWAEGPSDSERFLAAQWTLGRFGRRRSGLWNPPRRGFRS
jgi:hypothetical protein